MTPKRTPRLSHLLTPFVFVFLFGCGKKVCTYEDGVGKWCALDCKGDAQHALIDSDDPEGMVPGKKTCESLGYECGEFSPKNGACRMPKK